MSNLALQFTSQFDGAGDPAAEFLDDGEFDADFDSTSGPGTEEASDRGSALDGRATAGEARQRQAVSNPELLLWESLMELAVQRINSIYEFARNWDRLRHEPDYELQRARCLFHLEWIFDDEPSDRFTFRELCRFSDSPLLQEVEPARLRIRQAFSPAARAEMLRPVSPKLRKHIVQVWLGNECGSTLVLPIRDPGSQRGDSPPEGGDDRRAA